MRKKITTSILIYLALCTYCVFTILGEVDEKPNNKHLSNGKFCSAPMVNMR